MEDSSIVALFWARDEQALTETTAKYGKYCWNISFHILKNRQDAEECVNDTYVQAWNAIPPQKPFALGAFLGKITRNLSINVYRSRSAQKRGGGLTMTVIEELLECGGDSPEMQLEAVELSHLLDRFLRELPRKDCCIFMRRYWYVDTLEEIAGRYGMALGTVKSSLFRSRKKLKAYLEKEGITI